MPVVDQPVRLAASKPSGTMNTPLGSSAASSPSLVYVWADGVYFNIRAEDDRQCILVLIGVSDTGGRVVVF